jgi:UDP-hydrolysing UDP-N-acetyl-D-glucosamine 2-epimerase
MRKRKICVVVTARPSYARIRSAMQAIVDHPELELQLVTAATAILERFGNVAKVMEADGFSVARRVHTILEGGNRIAQAKSTGLGLIEMTSVFEELQPDAAVTIADRFETMATAVAASYMNIPLVHIQGGEVTGSIDNKVRFAITKMADLHLVSTVQARARVIATGENPRAVHVTGCPSIDIAADVMREPALPPDLFARYKGVGGEPDLARGYLVVLQHPVTTEDDEAFFQVEETLHAVHDLGIPTLWFWPNVDAGSDVTSHGIRLFREKHRAPQIHFFKNLPPEDFLRLTLGSIAIVGNSSVGIRECAYLGVPAVNIGSRQRGRDRGANVIDVPHDRHAIAAAIRRAQTSPRPPSDPVYGDGQAGVRIAEAIAQAPLAFDK